jgi:cytochrome c oxidase cbb3-type subunit 3
MSTDSTTHTTPKAEPGGPMLRPHTYDGIQEFDQKLPNWWLWTLYLAIMWTFISWLWDFQFARPLHLATTDGQRVEKEVVAVKTQQAEHLQKILTTLDDKRFWEMSKDAEFIGRGQVTFETICSACHAKDMSATMPGGIKLPGLPLNDAEWKYGGKPMDVFKTVMKGSPDITKGMIAWEPQIGGAKVAEVVAFILSKHEAGPDGVAK